MIENKIKIIDEICKKHPSWGVDAGFSYYTGGMKDSGDWYFRKMLDVPIETLQFFLDRIIAEENKPKELPLMGQDLIDSQTVVCVNGYWTNVYTYNKMKELKNNQELKLWGLK